MPNYDPHCASRGSGRTTAMLELAERLADRGHQILVVMATTSIAAMTRDRLISPNIRVTTMTDPMLDIVTPAYAGMNPVILVDHNVYEVTVTALRGELRSAKDRIVRLEGDAGS